MATKKSKKRVPKKATPKAGKKPRKPRAGQYGAPNKSAFIREQPTTMSAKEVVEAAKAKGIVLTEGFVYNVRSNTKRGGRAAPAKRGPGRAKVAPAGDEAAFRSLVVQLGTAQARVLVDEVEAKLAAVIAGK